MMTFENQKQQETMKKYEGKSIRKVKTSTGKLPANVGFPGQGGGGIIDHRGLGPE